MLSSAGTWMAKARSSVCEAPENAMVSAQRAVVDAKAAVYLNGPPVTRDSGGGRETSSSVLCAGEPSWMHKVGVGDMAMGDL